MKCNKTRKVANIFRINGVFNAYYAGVRIDCDRRISDLKRRLRLNGFECVYEGAM